MLKETKEMTKLGDKAFYTHVKGQHFQEKVSEIKHVHDEIKTIGGKGLSVTLTLKEQAKLYIDKCQSYGLLVKEEGTTGIELTLPENINAFEIDEKVSLLNKVFYEAKAEKALVLN